MPKDVIITPANSYMEFRDTNSNVDAMIYLDNSRNLNIFNPNGSLTLGNTAANVFIGDGTSVVDIVFEQNGSVRALTGKTLTLGQSDSSVAFAGNVTNGFRVTSGNVGIGTTTPAASLQVVGGAIMPAVGNTATAGIQFPSDPGGGTGDRAYIRYFARTSESMTLLLGTENDTDDHIAVVPGGNFGVGTITPSSKLHVIGTANVTANLTLGAGAVGSPSLTTAGDDNTGIFFPAADTMAFVEGGSEIMRIDSSGRVTIGNTTGEALFSVYQSTDGSPAARFRGPTRNLAIIPYYNSEGNDYGTWMYAYNTSGSAFNRLTIGASAETIINPTGGNVGIATTAPTSNLHVIGTANVSANLTVGAGSNTAPSITTAGDNNTGIFFPAADTIAFTEGGSEVMRVTSTSNVAIGTTTASYKVDVTGDIRASGNMISVSDLRTKQNIQTINSALQKVVNLRGVYFNRIGSNTKHIGVIAQEVKEILPEVVSYTENEDRYSVAYGNMVGILIEAIKEQNEKIVELENKLNQIKTD